VFPIHLGLKRRESAPKTACPVARIAAYRYKNSGKILRELDLFGIAETCRKSHFSFSGRFLFREETVKIDIFLRQRRRPKGGGVRAPATEPPQQAYF